MQSQTKENTKEKKQRILFVVPPSGLYRRDDRCQSKVEDQTVRVLFPPMDLAMLAAMARDAGREPRIVDYPAATRTQQHAIEDLEHQFQSFQPEILFFSLTTATLEADLQVAALAKKYNPNICTIARGELLEHLGQKVLATHPELDLGLHGEVEVQWQKILEGTPLQKIEAACFRDHNGHIQTNDRPAIVPDLDALPLPARDLLDNTLYRSPETGNPLAVIQANRGCPSRCIFCPAGRLSHYRLRLRHPATIVEEIRQCVTSYGIREFLFNGDTFTMKKSWLLELCERIQAANLDIRWGCNSRVDTMDQDRAEALKSAGCWVVAFGVESGDQAMLDRMGKGARLEQAEAAIATAKAAGLLTHAFFIIGLPWETRQTLERTYRFCRKINTDFFDMNIAFPLPGTEYYDIAKAEGLLEGKGSYAQAAVHTHALSAQDLTRWRRRALLRLYARPGYIYRTVKRAIREKKMGHYAQAAKQRLLSLLKG